SVRMPMPGPTSSIVLNPCSGCSASTIRVAIRVSVRKCCPKYFFALTAGIQGVLEANLDKLVCNLKKKTNKFDYYNIRLIFGIAQISIWFPALKNIGVNKAGGCRVATCFFSLINLYY